jgi:antirestriction protein ArdC
MVCCVLQITGELRHTSYVDPWLKILKGDSKAILIAAISSRRDIAALRSDQRAHRAANIISPARQSSGGAAMNARLNSIRR